MEIYEGDIVEDPARPWAKAPVGAILYEVCFIEGCFSLFSFVVRGKYLTGNEHKAFAPEECECLCGQQARLTVVGNIHDNPKLTGVT